MKYKSGRTMTKQNDQRCTSKWNGMEWWFDEQGRKNKRNEKRNENANFKAIGMLCSYLPILLLFDFKHISMAGKWFVSDFAVNLCARSTRTFTVT